MNEPHRNISEGKGGTVTNKIRTLNKKILSYLFRSKDQSICLKDTLLIMLIYQI